MALFKKSQKDTKADETTKKVDTSSKSEAPVETVHTDSVYGILRTPRVTEKATDVAENNVYTFNVDPRSTKKEIAKAVETIFGVKPVSIRTAMVPGKKVRYRGRPGKRSGGKKAYVQLKKGETIELL